MKKGFTLIELLVVVLIIGILSAVALPQYERAVARARLSEILVVSRAVENAERLYFMANGDYSYNFEDLEDIEEEYNFLSKMPSANGFENEYEKLPRENFEIATSLSAQ